MRIVLVMHPDYADLWQRLMADLPEAERIGCLMTYGGSTRCESVANGLECVASHVAAEKPQAGSPQEVVVLIHDGARPLLTAPMIRRGIEALRQGCGAIPALASVNSLRRLTDLDEPLTESRSESVPRAEYVEVQTPQIFYLEDIRRAYAKGLAECGAAAFTDDASVAEYAGMQINLYEGLPANIKVTHADDFVIAEALLARRIQMSADEADSKASTAT